MSTNGDYIRPLFPGLTLPDTTTVGLQRALPVGPEGGMVRDALSHVKPGETFTDADWLTVTWDETQTLGDPPPNLGIIDDQFSGSTISSLWGVIGGFPSVSAGRLHLPNRYPQSAIRTVVQHNLAGTTVSLLGFLCPPGTNNDTAKLRGIQIKDAASPGTNFVQVIKYNPTPGVLLTRTNPGSQATIPYNATNHANLRIRFTAGQIYFEGSANATTWTILRQVPYPAWIANAQAYLQIYGGASSSQWSDTTTEASIDRITWA